MNKKVLIYLGHPAQYHFFKNIINLLNKNNVQVEIVIKTKDVLEELLISDNLKYVNILPNPRKSNRVSIIISLFKRFIKLFWIIKKHNPQILIGSDAAISWVGYILKINTITVLEDDEKIIKQLGKLTFPYTSAIVVPTSCKIDTYIDKVVKYDGYMKLAYLHPKYFNKINNLDKIFLIRISGLDAYHDKNKKGISIGTLKYIIDILNDFGKVYISSEKDLPIEFRKFNLKCSPSDMHNYISQCHLIVSDSQSMTVEAAMLGIPNIRYSDFVDKIGVLNELEYKYGLTYGIKPNNKDKLISKISEIINNKEIIDVFQKRRVEMLNDKIDVSSFFSWFIYEFPKSFDIMKSKPNYQDRFKL